MITINIRKSDTQADATFHAERAIGSKTGLITSIRFDLNPRGHDRWSVTHPESTDLARLLPQDWTEEPTLSVSGKGGTFEQQLLTTVGEFVERYCAHWPVTSATHDMTTASYEEMRVSELPVVDFEYLDLYDPEQLEETSQAPFERTTTTKWIPGKNLLTGETVHVPTELVYMGEHTDWEGQSANFFSTSNGCACGSDPDSAVLGALYEGLERDAVMCSWFRETPPRRLDLSEWPQLDALREKVTTANSEIHVLEFDSETDVHTLGGMYVNRRDRRPKFMLAGGSNLDFRSAVRDALLEAEQGIKALKKAAAFEEHPNVDVTTITNLEDNIRYYIHPDNFD